MAQIRRTTFAEAPLHWLRENLFSSLGNAFLTLFGLYIIWSIAASVIDWAIVRAVWQGESRDDCIYPGAGACWPYIINRTGQIIYGFYDWDARWRADIVLLLGTAGVAALMIPRVPGKRYIGFAMLLAYPILAFFLLSGGVFGLSVVQTSRWGGLLLTLVVAATGIVISLPLGVLLALGRQSSMPVVRWASIAFIEVWRGVPLITVLFMAANMWQLFLPEGASSDKLMRALVAVAIFSSAYMAEVVRGGLQAIPRGQYEAAKALGLPYWQMMGFIVLPQALRLVIPGIVNTFIGLFKDTTLISIIGFFDLLGIIQTGNQDPNWASPNTPFTGYLFVGIVFWSFCFGMSRYSQAIERKLGISIIGDRR
jgi:general L-amino acid transport system permease protein